MITEFDLREAIAECEGTKNPSASTCIKLAAFYTILEHLYGEEKEISGYSFSNKQEIPFSDSEFSMVVKSIGIEKCFPIIDEIMSTLYITNPALYRSAIRRLTDM